MTHMDYDRPQWHKKHFPNILQNYLPTPYLFSNFIANNKWCNWSSVFLKESIFFYFNLKHIHGYTYEQR